MLERTAIVACAALVVGCAAAHGPTENQVRTRVGRFMSHPASPLTLVDVPSCVRGDRDLEWRCSVRERDRYTHDMVELTVLATCDERTCRLERNP